VADAAEEDVERVVAPEETEDRLASHADLLLQLHQAFVVGIEL